jgi:hypothetical protein
MHIARLAAAALAVAIAFGPTVQPVLAQQGLDESAEPRRPLIGMPVYTSDGRQLGEVIQVGRQNDQPALRAEIGSFLGLGSTTVIIPTNMFQQRGNRIELSMTAAEVRELIAKQR